MALDSFNEDDSPREENPTDQALQTSRSNRGKHGFLVLQTQTRDEVFLRSPGPV